MAGDLQIKLDPKGREYLAKAEARFRKSELYGQIVRFFDSQAPAVAGRAIKEATRLLRVRTGELRRSITGFGTLVNSLPALRVGVLKGPSLKYAGVQEFGTKGEDSDSPYDTIKPVNAKALAMPVGAALTAAGVSRFESPSQFPEPLEFLPFKKSGSNVVGALYPKSDIAAATAARDEGRSLRDLQAAYLLLRQTDIKGAHYLRSGVQESLGKVSQGLSRLLKSLLSGKPRPA